MLSLFYWCWHVQTQYHHHFQALGIFCIFNKIVFFLLLHFMLFASCMKNCTRFFFEISSFGVLKLCFFFFWSIILFVSPSFLLLSHILFSMLSHLCWVLWLLFTTLVFFLAQINSFNFLFHYYYFCYNPWMRSKLEFCSWWVVWWHFTLWMKTSRKHVSSFYKQYSFHAFQFKS